MIAFTALVLFILFLTFAQPSSESKNIAFRSKLDYSLINISVTSISYCLQC
ncbi:unnamed protein product [Brassica napus]|uniref:(rape) hypothetical protein n=1 Tax=Brassica napus TaxID=3708 RepID=A0A816NZ49_BRANA|nr:unnamed protein product [Brassica napus]